MRFIIFMLLITLLFSGCPEGTSTEVPLKFSEGQLVTNIIDGRQGLIIAIREKGRASGWDYKVKFPQDKKNRYSLYITERCREDELRAIPLKEEKEE